METLKGIFSVPKMDRNRRNFLRENKLSLRELQRVTNKNRMLQEQEQIIREQKLVGRRSQSQQRNNNIFDKPTVSRCPSLSRVPSGRAAGPSIGGSIGDGVNNNGRRHVSRTNSTTTIKSVHKQVQTEDIQDEQFLYDALKRCTTNDCISRSNGLQPNYTPRSQHTVIDAPSRNTFYPPAVDDVDPRGLENTTDQPYAMQKQMEDQYVQHSNEQKYTQQHYNGQQLADSSEGDNEAALQGENVERSYAPDSSSKYNFAPTPRSQQHFTNGYNMVENDGLPPTTTMQSSYEPPDQQQQQAPLRYRMQPHVQEELRGNFENMSLNNGYGGAGDCDISGDDDCANIEGANSGGVEAVSISGRSRRTNFSQHSNTDLTKKRSNGSVHKLGSRDNISLPRYLEREKREREEQRQRESERDPNCPPGHYPLTDKERQAALQSAETRFKALINELNRMPMTTETLRMRVRKAEIEKELKQLETDIRVFSKTKVYVKHKQ
ncbi:uncharacterized protein LOC101451115 [Ceratitis capitata]|uniref:(Mediterranean fruit fly) hypothetical protein n=1 Tax=Ceratitis capitata TaxID=7213 RepID=W8CCH0_CERCA|nr:uncharacterized protein LOC101451115 [Ceratitis capitata]CAD7012192.1 unnamed protein product [Ceratitis capitata]